MIRSNTWRTELLLTGTALAVACAVDSSAGPPVQTQIPSTPNDFFEPGTQPGTLVPPNFGPLIVQPNNCRNCHSMNGQPEDDGNIDETVAPYDNWVLSMMAHSARDPLWYAALAIANQDAADVGEMCIRCHSPNAWLSGRSLPADASGFSAVDGDFNGVHCSICHRTVDPIASTMNPAEDTSILAALAKNGELPPNPVMFGYGNGRYVIDPVDVRRGPIPFCEAQDETCLPPEVPMNLHGVPILESPFHRDGVFCGSCHDVSNPMYSHNAKNGTYELNDLDEPHPTGDSYDMAPEQRTYSEWLHSAFANGGVQMNGRFGGDHPTGIMQSCQDCHMPRMSGGLCAFWQDPPFFQRPDIPQHSFIGANTWVLGAVYDLYGDSATGITEDGLTLYNERVTAMLRAASDMQLSQRGSNLRVRVINYSGHKLPSGYPEGQRMWLNVRFLDASDELVLERGAYDYVNATLTENDTTVYEAKFGMDEAVATATGLNAGPSFHLALNNKLFKDNRIPPMGFTNAAFSAAGAGYIGNEYADGEHWDESHFAVPVGAVKAVVTLYYQTTSREYIEFLRDTNVTNADGNVAYDAWEARGKSAPVDMDTVEIDLVPSKPGDANLDGFVGIADLLIVIGQWGACPPQTFCQGDVNSDGVVGIADLLMVIGNWGA